MADVFDELYGPLTDLIVGGKVEFFFSYARGCKCCAIDDIVLEFYEEEEGSLTVRYQNLRLMWIRETPGWNEVVRALAAVPEEDEENRGTAINRRLYMSLCSRLSAKGQKGPSSD